MYSFAISFGRKNVFTVRMRHYFFTIETQLFLARKKKKVTLK